MSQTIDHTAVDLEDFSAESFGLASSARVRRGLGADFAKLWGATTASNLSDGIRLAALPLLAASTTSDPRQIAGVAFATQAPWLIFGIASGALVDRFDRRRTIALAHIFRIFVVGVLAVAVGFGIVPIVLLYVAAFLLGTAETLFDNASQVIVAELVDQDQLERANGRQAMAMLVGQHLIGPALGAALFVAAVPAPLVIDALVLLLAAVLVLSIKTKSDAVVARRTSLRSEVAESIRWLWRQRTLRAISLAAAAVNIAVMAHIAVFVLFCLEVLGISGISYALILGCYALGGIAGGWLTPYVTQRVGWRGATILALLIGGGSILWTGMTSEPLVVAGMQIVLGVAASVWTVVTSSLRQRWAPEGMLGKVTGAHALLSWGGAALGALAGGAVAALYGLRAPFFAGAAVLGLIAIGLLVLTEPTDPAVSS